MARRGGYFAHQGQVERRSNLELDRERRETQAELDSWSTGADGGLATSAVRYVIDSADGGAA